MCLKFGMTLAGVDVGAGVVVDMGLGLKDVMGVAATVGDRGVGAALIGAHAARLMQMSNVAVRRRLGFICPPVCYVELCSWQRGGKLATIIPKPIRASPEDR